MPFIGLISLSTLHTSTSFSMVKWNLGSVTNKYDEAYRSQHYDKTHTKYTLIFNGCKTDNFQMKKIDIFLIFAQNIDCWYTLKPPQYEAVLMCTNNVYFEQNKNVMYTPVNHSTTI